MSTGRKIPWDDAAAIAEAVSAELTPLVKRIKCVGSVRRRKAECGDIEFLAEPHFDQDLLGGRTAITDPVERRLRELGTWVAGGTRHMRIVDVLGRTGLHLEVYLVHPPASWGSLLAIRTGPADLGRYVMTACRQHGFRHQNGYARRLDTGERVPTDTEAQFFALADVECLPPHRRDVQAEALWAQYQRNGATA